MYRIGARLRGIRRREIDRVELAELGEPQGAGGRGDLVVAFSHPLCTDCRTVLGDLAAGSQRWVSVDVRDRPDLARKYGVALVPTVVRVAADGRVLQQMAG
jgi:thioredoxin-like negative regulator of GroEL